MDRLSENQQFMGQKNKRNVRRENKEEDDGGTHRSAIDLVLSTQRERRKGIGGP